MVWNVVYFVHATADCRTEHGEILGLSSMYKLKLTFAEEQWRADGENRRNGKALPTALPDKAHLHVIQTYLSAPT